MFLNSTENGLIWIKDLHREIEGEEPFPSRIGSGNFGAKRRDTFAGWIWVMKPVVLFNKRESEISQRDTSKARNLPESGAPVRRFPRVLD